MESFFKNKGKSFLNKNVLKYKTKITGLFISEENRLGLKTMYLREMTDLLRIKRG